MICEWLDVYKDGNLLTDTTGLRNGDIIVVTVRTDKRPGYVFVGWVDINGERLNPYPVEVVGTEFPTFTFTLTCDSYINALFRQGIAQMVTISAISNDETLGTVSGGATVEVGTEVELEAAVIDPCYSRFVNWIKKVDGTIVSTDEILTVIATENKLYEGVFATVDYTINLTANNYNYGSVEQSGSIYKLGDHVILTATPNENCTFDGWYEDDVLIGTNASFEYVIQSSGDVCQQTRNIQGKFSSSQFTVYIYNDNDEVPNNNITINQLI